MTWPSLLEEDGVTALDQIVQGLTSKGILEGKHDCGN